MRGTMAGVMLMAVVGCSSKGGPDSARLDVGDAAILYAPNPRVTLGKVEGLKWDSEIEREGKAKERLKFVPAGTRVVVLDDAGKAQVATASGQDYRSVRVEVKEGESEGVVGVVSRFELRPVK